MTNKYKQPLMIDANFAESIFDEKFEERELSSYTDLINPNTAKLKIYGPLMRHGSWWSDFLGLSAYSSITKEFKKLLEEPQIENIILDIDSPGGMVNGCGELADFIYNSRDKKNIISYVSGTGCSAAYYLASASSKVYVHKSAKVGSIGVIACIDIVKDKNVKQIEIVSSKSKEKRLNVESKEGKDKIQQEVDALADIFIDDVAKFRSVSTEQIEQTNGGTFIGQDGIASGLVDEVSDLETILKEISMTDHLEDKKEVVEAKAEVKQVEVTQAEPTAEKVDTVDLVAQERSRVSAIMAKGNELNLSALAQDLVNADTEEKTALKMLDSAEKDTQTKHPSIAGTGFTNAMAKVENPEVKAKGEEDSQEATINSIVDIANKM